MAQWWQVRVEQLQIVPLLRSSFPLKHVRAWIISMNHRNRLRLWDCYAFIVLEPVSNDNDAMRKKS